MSPKLYGILLSPPVRAVLTCASELGLELELIEVNLANGDHLGEDFLKKNPSHTVPVLEDEDGFVLSDSHAITAYLVAKYGKSDSLYPINDIKRKALIDQVLYFDASVLFARALMILKRLRSQPGTKPTEEDGNQVKDSLESLERILKASKGDYVAGDQLSIADFSITTTTTTVASLVPYDDFPHIKAYIERMQSQPWYKENVKGLEMFREMYAAILGK